MTWMGDYSLWKQANKFKGVDRIVVLGKVEHNISSELAIG